jgi:hypothetical protein
MCSHHAVALNSGVSSVGMGLLVQQQLADSSMHGMAWLLHLPLLRSHTLQPTTTQLKLASAPNQASFCDPPLGRTAAPPGYGPSGMP